MNTTIVTANHPFASRVALSGPPSRGGYDNAPKNYEQRIWTLSDASGYTVHNDADRADVVYLRSTGDGAFYEIKRDVLTCDGSNHRSVTPVELAEGQSRYFLRRDGKAIVLARSGPTTITMLWKDVSAELEQRAQARVPESDLAGDTLWSKLQGIAAIAGVLASAQAHVDQKNSADARSVAVGKELAAQRDDFFSLMY